MGINIGSYGYGDGYGSSDGDGYGYGDGDGYGDGSGDGDGYGYGSGDGYGDGDGDGDGYGYGYGSGEYWTAAIQTYLSAMPITQQTRATELQKAGATLAYWISDENGLACNGGKKTAPAAPGLIETTGGPLRICTSSALHATNKPVTYKGSRRWIVALVGEIQTQDDKFAALQREIIGEALQPS